MTVRVVATLLMFLLTAFIRSFSSTTSNRYYRRDKKIEKQFSSVIRRTMTLRKSFTFYAIGDFGSPTPEIIRTAAAMTSHANKSEWNEHTAEIQSVAYSSPSFVLGLGDNFYPSGIRSMDDIRFQTDWYDRFCRDLPVPWHVCLGNHDYEGNPDAQVQFTYSQFNPNQLWNMPSKNYEFTESIKSAAEEGAAISIDFFCLDTNGVQVNNETIAQELHHRKADLAMKLRNSTAKWKIVFGHHPMYTRGKLHGILGKCLRDETYLTKGGKVMPGFGFEKVFAEGGVDAYITGHEHTFQHHLHRGIHHFIVGAAGYNNRLYGGENHENVLDWVDSTNTNGFMAVHVSENALTFQFISNRNLDKPEILKEIQVFKYTSVVKDKLNSVFLHKVVEDPLKEKEIEMLIEKKKHKSEENRSTERKQSI